MTNQTPQVSAALNPIVVLRAGKQTLEKTDSGYVICNGTLTDWVTFLPGGRYSLDGMFPLNVPIARKLHQLAFDFSIVRKAA